ncbi:MAG: helix-turn-helix domain-containing protein [Candidatus Poribacteria bacterium]
MSIRMFTSKEVMGILDISRQTLSRWIKERKLRCFKIGRNMIFREDDIFTFIKKNRNIYENQIYDILSVSRKEAVADILSKSVKISGITTSDLIRMGREERELKIG